MLFSYFYPYFRIQDLAKSCLLLKNRYFLTQKAHHLVYSLSFSVPLKPLVSGTPTLLVCQVSLMGGEIIEVAPRVPYSYEPGSVVAFVDRNSGRSQMQ